MSKRVQAAILALVLLTVLTACQKTPAAPLHATNVEVAAAIPGMRMNVGYLTLTNNTDTAILISEITSDEFASVQLHDTIIENGIAKMRPLAKLTIPPHSSITLERGGKHLMLMQADAAPVTVSLHFYSDTALLLSVQTTVARQSK